ncbi:MAG: helix-turn-helix transcriptional regulator [Clostridia bacterium]|nr:helix-turn-helix transcriptional regulator [Clostridia bacterium]
MYENIPMYSANMAIRDKTNISCIKTVYDSPHPSGPFHWHDYYSLDIITGGTGIHNINGKEVIPVRGDLILTTPTDIHNFRSDTCLDMSSVLFSDSVVDKKYLYAIQNACSVKLSESELASALNCYREIEAANLKLRESDDDLEVDTVNLNLTLLLILLAKKIGKPEVVSGNKVTDLLQYLNMHFREHLSIEKAAQAIGLTPAYFSTWFKKNVGMSYVEYLNNLRIDYAVSMIKRGHSIIDSCYASGFGSLSHFNHTFKNKLGVTPKEFR